MTVTVGTDVYLSVADADTYWSNRNDSTWSAATTAAKEAALREATQYIDGSYSFIGVQNVDNVLAWPRYDVLVTQGNLAGVIYDQTTIPPQIKAATAELALQALSSRLAPVADRGGLIKREKVDSLEVEYMDFAPAGKTYSFVGLILKPLLANGGGNTLKRLTRS